MSGHSEVAALLDTRVEACRAKNIDQLMSLYSDDIVYFDVVPPLHFTGRDSVRRNFLRWFAEYDGPIDLETRDLTISASGDVAFAHMLHMDRGRMRGGSERELWLRSTVCCQRSEDGWRITHEHISAPLDPKRWTAAVDSTP